MTTTTSTTTKNILTIFNILTFFNVFYIFYIFKQNILEFFRLAFSMVVNPENMIDHRDQISWQASITK